MARSSCRISAEVGRAHFELVRERREWARNLEHLPGVNLEWSEIIDFAAHFPEFAQWTFYRGDRAKTNSAIASLENHSWSASAARAGGWRRPSARGGRMGHGRRFFPLNGVMLRLLNNEFKT